MNPKSAAVPADTTPLKNGRLRVRLSLIVTLLGAGIFLLGAKPNWLGLDRSPVVGFVQIAVFLIGLGIICLGGYVGLTALWSGRERSIVADIGLRLIATGYVVAVFAGMADVFGMGTQLSPRVPFFGPLQAVGVAFGELVIAAGLVMLIPFQTRKVKNTSKVI